MSFPQRRTLMKSKSEVVHWSDPNRFPQQSACSFEYGRPTGGTVFDEVGWSDTPHSITLWWLGPNAKGAGRHCPDANAHDGALSPLHLSCQFPSARFVLP